MQCRSFLPWSDAIPEMGRPGYGRCGYPCCSFQETAKIDSNETPSNDWKPAKAQDHDRIGSVLLVLAEKRLTPAWIAGN